jgi:cell division protein FtsQ
MPHPTDDVFVPPNLHDDPLYVPAAEEKQAMEEEKKRRHLRKMRHIKQQRLRKKRLQSRQRRLMVIGAVLLVFLLWLFLRLAPVPFGALIVDGNDTMTNEDVYQACGVSGYVNVIQLSPGDIQERLCKDLRIDDAVVERRFPATIQVTMKERKAAAVITTMYGFAYIDEKGKVMELGPQIKGVSVPIMTGKKMDTILLGDDITDESIRASLVYLQSLSPDVLKTITEINVGNPDGIVAYTTDSLPIHLGSGNDAVERAAITEELLQEVKHTDVAVQYIDTDIRAPLVMSK